MKNSYHQKFTGYCDGGCRPNPGIGGWGFILINSDPSEEVQHISGSGGEPQTTNNRMELTALIKLLGAAPMEADLELYLDSKYVIDGITSKEGPIKSITGWAHKPKPTLKNPELWIELLELVRLRLGHLSIKWVKGHSKNAGNDIVDKLCTLEIEKLSKK